MKTIKYLSMAALALVGIIMTGCSSEDNIINEPQQPAKTDNIVTLTTTVGFDGGAASTRALTSTGEKTFAEGDKIAVIYTNTSDATVKAESVALTSNDIASGGKTATFTVTLSNPKGNGNVKYIYPAAMAGDTDVDYTKLATQDGTLASLAANLDLAVYDGTLTPDAKLPASSTLTNQLAILAMTLKNSEGTEITNTITGLSISDGTNSYTVKRSAVAGPIYVAIKPTSSANISVNAKGGTNYYEKTLNGKTYAINNGYPLTWQMASTTTINLATVSQGTVIPNGALVTGTIQDNSNDGGMIFIENNASVTLSGVTIEAKRPIECKGDAIIILADGTTNTLTASVGTGLEAGGYQQTLTIRGTGTLNATGGIYSPGIGNYFKEIIIEGGTINAQGASYSAGIGLGYQADGGNITITGGNVNATGGSNAPGIGCGEGRHGDSKDNPSVCGNITISGGSVTAKAGSNSPYSIGVGKTLGTCGTITIGGTVYYDGTNFQNDGETYLATSPFTWSTP